MEEEFDNLIGENTFDDAMKTLSILCRLSKRRIKLTFKIVQYGEDFDEYQNTVRKELSDKLKILENQLC